MREKLKDLLKDEDNLRKMITDELGDPSDPDQLDKMVEMLKDIAIVSPNTDLKKIIREFVKGQERGKPSKEQLTNMLHDVMDGKNTKGIVRSIDPRKEAVLIITAKNDSFKVEGSVSPAQSMTMLRALKQAVKDFEERMKSFTDGGDFNDKDGEGIF